MLALTASPAPLAIGRRSITTREEWLVAAVEALTPLFAEVGKTVPTVRVSCGFPGGGSARKRIGECWSTKTAKDKIANVFISPVLDDPTVVLSTLTHELVHAVDDCASGHKGEFRKIATAVGLAGKMTATHAGEVLQARLVEIANELGAYPHSALSLGGRPKQSTRLLKVSCPECGYIARVTAKWLEEIGAPICPCNEEPMIEG
jgi:hypothetical protein